jgi:TetR/AcrR family transcriptional repressor of nem operon
MAKAESTRLNLLQKAFELIYQKGYQSTSIDDIIATTQVTKGAFFYHFKNKEEMGLAMINEIMHPSMLGFLGGYLQRPGDIRTIIYEMMEGLLLDDKFFKVEYGCPAVNMVEEMAPVSDAFRKALIRLTNAWQREIENAVRSAQNAGQMDLRHDARDIAHYVTGNYGGARYLGKIFGRPSYVTFLQEFRKYLDNLN